jgi:effector-binding domain-containing protein
MSDEVTVQTIDDRLVLSHRQAVTLNPARATPEVLTLSAAVDRWFGRLYEAVAAAGQEAAGAPMVIYHDALGDHNDGDVELCVPIASAIDPAPGTEVRTVAGGRVAALVHRGDYSNLPSAHVFLASWVQEHGHQMAGPPRESYLNDPTTVEPDEIETLVEWPIA